MPEFTYKLMVRLRSNQTRKGNTHIFRKRTKVRHVMALRVEFIGGADDRAKPRCERA